MRQLTMGFNAGKLGSTESRCHGGDRLQARAEGWGEAQRSRYLVLRASPRLALVRDRVARSYRGIAVLLVGLVAALAYCSWPVGYLVNPSLAAGALASELEARGQPYSWLFILLDCATGAAALLVVRPHLADARIGEYDVAAGRTRQLRTVRHLDGH